MTDDIEKVVGKKGEQRGFSCFYMFFPNTNYFRITNDAEIRFGGSVIHRYPPEDDVDIRGFRETPVSLCAKLFNGTEAD